MPDDLWLFFKRHRNALRILPKTTANAILYFFNKKCHGIP
jgi:hypothetical protein